MAEVPSPRDSPTPRFGGDGHRPSAEGGQGTRREGVFRRAISRMVRAHEPPSPETEQGNPVHHPVHPHSQDPGRTPDRGQHKSDDAPKSGKAARGGESASPATGSFSGPTENGYRPSARVSVPNPYTKRRVNVDEVDSGATPVGQWRGVGLNEPEPRSSHIPATTDTMTDTSSERPEQTEKPVASTQASAANPVAAAQQSPLTQPAPARTEPQSPEAPRPEPQAEDRQDEAMSPPTPPQPWASAESDGIRAEGRSGAQPQAGPDTTSQGEQSNRQPPQAPTWSAHQQHHQAFPPHPDRQGHVPPPGPVQHHAPMGHDPYTAHGGPYPQAPGMPYGGPPHWQDQNPHAPRSEGYAHPPQQHGGYAPHPQGPPVPYAPQQPHYQPQPAPYPAPYPSQPLVTYQSAYPAPFQPPGYVLHGQPVFYTGQYNPYGQPVQHVIVLAAGQQPQVISAESASTLLAELSESGGDAREGRALPHAEREAAPDDEEGEKAAAPEVGTESDEQRATSVPETEEEPAPAAEAVQDRSVAAEVDKSGTGTDDGLLNEALAGLAMRDLSLVDALLEMVEELETEAKDPDLLDKLFQIDNFATRMRRNGENFLVLTGHDGGESDAHDEIVPLLDVARAATSEIKDYPRVRLGKIPQTSITGMAADDISHLLAELLDNATANSPEHSQVVISAQELNDGRLMIVVEDEGVGIPEAQLGELNQRLSGEPVLDDTVPRHMGLYVASRIAEKHGLETRLESRSFRGVSAYTIIPKELLRVATPRTPGQARTSSIPASAPVAPIVPARPTTPVRPAASGPSSNGVARPPSNGAAKPSAGGSSAVTAAGLPRRSATPHGSPLRMMPRPGQTPEGPPKARQDTPPKLTGEARAKQIHDELGDFFDGEREAREGSDEPKGDKK